MNRDDMEREANYFARCLLMPRDFVLADLKLAGGMDICDDDAVKVLAKKYGVSISMMALRIHEVGSEGALGRARR